MPSLRKLSRRETVLVALLGVVIAALASWWLWPAGKLPLARPRLETGPTPPPIPNVDLARLDRPRPDADAGRRNLFDFGSAPAPPPVAPPVVVATPPAQGRPGLDPLDAAGAPVVPTLPPLNVRYIGSVENAAGVKVAVLVTDRQEVLTGQPGQVIANRYRIARIGLESLDLEDVATGQSRRLPLKGS